MDGMNISKRKFWILFLQLLILFGLIFYFRLIYKVHYSNDEFIRLSRIGLLIIILDILFVIITQKEIITSITLVFLSFIVFQYGLPILYATIKGYDNFYINLLSEKAKILGNIYSILSIHVFSLALSFGLLNNRKNSVVFSGRRWVMDKQFVNNISFILFILNLIFMFPLMLYSAYTTLRFGFWQANTRSFLSSNGFFNAIRTFCIPFGFLYLVYSKKSFKRKFVFWACISIFVLQLLSGDRTNGLAGLLALVILNINTDDKADIANNVSKKGKKDFGRQILLIIILILLGILLSYVAVARVSNKNVSLSTIFTNGLLKGIFQELGLNFTTICFVMMYVPIKYGFRYGGSYFGSFLCLLPKSLDPTGTIAKIGEMNPETWLYNANKYKFGNLLDFGVGFSTIGESFLNFSWFGLIAIFILGFIICKMINRDLKKCSHWEKYVQIVMIMYLMTFARRGFYDLLKNIEYSIFFVALILVLLYQSRVFNKNHS